MPGDAIEPEPGRHGEPLEASGSAQCPGGPSELPVDWSRWRGQIDLGDYDERWRRMAEAGQNPHGEADLVCRYRPASVLDAGCGTGRVAIELARRGIRTLGVDADPDMIAAARAKAPELDWLCADLSELELEQRFDVVLLAGNVVPYIRPGARGSAVCRCARMLAGGGRMIAGFSMRPGWPAVEDYLGWCESAGLAIERRFATWDGSPFVDVEAGGDYLVAVARKEEQHD